MSRPHGAANTRTEDRIVKQAPCFPDARRALVDVLESFCFVKVVSVTGSGSGSYHGEAVETSFRDAREKPKLLFFDKYGRTKGLMRIGPMQVAQAPLGPDHSSSVPSPGDFLFGSAVPNTRKGPQEFVLRGWSSDAKPIWELLRILKFGTRSTEFECRSLLVQPCSSLMQASGLHKSVRDDIYMTARIILWKSLRPLQVLASLQNPDFKILEPASDAEKLQARGIKISSNATDFVDALTLKFNDSNISETFMSGFESMEYDPEKQVAASGTAATAVAVQQQQHQQQQQYASQYVYPAVAVAAAPSAAAPFPQAYQLPQSSAPQSSTWLRDRLQSMLRSPVAGAAAPSVQAMPEPTAPRSPAPRSPEYAPRSPDDPAFAYAPTTTYVPTSPTYEPLSDSDI
jgi:hypothetical protein